MLERLKGIGSIAVLLAIMAIIGIVVGFLFLGIHWISGNVLPTMIEIGWILVAITLLVALPMSFLRATRAIAGHAMMLFSYYFGVVAWLSGFLFSYELWGGWAVFIGLIIAGVGVVPIGMLAAAFHSQWSGVGLLFGMVVLTFGVRFYAAYVIVRSQNE
ncbi:hypothetical protein [Leptothrix discophora]|uniref:Uncharacterized protein n=1 Tax=Leptothrix discophora TaxID=89 RepID=A0ABT9G0L0_LEPDI|nr:hypothetical protein [Leptothrix discophora]MDP4299951.1 hypothetical protein [Leptothrix discophora]